MATTCSRFSRKATRGAGHEGHADEAPGSASDRTEGVRRHPWLFLRELERAGVRACRDRREVRPGQRVALGEGRAAGPALSAAAAPGKADASTGGGDLRRRGRHPPQLAY